MTRLSTGNGIRDQNCIKWSTYDGKPLSSDIRNDLSKISEVMSGSFKASAEHVTFRDPDFFLSAEVHRHYQVWDQISQGYHKREEVLRYISDGVSILQFMRPFKGDFKGRHYDAEVPPKAILENSSICCRFDNFISESIIERVRNKSLSIWGKVGLCEPPHLVLPITVEPSKPRMCHDERFLNLWMEAPHFSLDYITDLPRYVFKDHFQAKLDDKSGYDHIRLSEDSKKYFGLQWKGWFFVYNTLPFGWSPSAYVYQTVGLAPSNFIRSVGVPMSQYIDDRHLGQFRPTPTSAFKSWSDEDFARASVYIAAVVLVSCGYFIGLTKSILRPTKEILFLGLISSSSKQAFILPERKRAKLATIRDALLQSGKKIPVKSLQRFAGHVTSVSLAVPAARLYTREVNAAIGKGLRSSSPVRLTESLKQELEHWKFLDTWHEVLPWKEEKHSSIALVSDASNVGWGGVLLPTSTPIETRDYWPDEIIDNTTIAVKEAKALHNTLTAFATEVFNTRVDAYVDNQNLLHSWNNGGGKNIALTNEIKDLYQLSLKLNINLNMIYVPSKDNLADAPSRFSTDIDCMLSGSTWKVVDNMFGPHSFDLMATPSNVRKDGSGHDLRFYSSLPYAQSSGVNIFAQELSPNENYYVFPPFILIGPLINFLRKQGVRCTVIAPDISPRKYWWPLLHYFSVERIKIGKKKERGVIFFPPNSRNAWHTRELPWDLYAFRIHF